MLRWLEDLIPANEKRIAQRMRVYAASCRMRHHSPENDVGLQGFLTSVSALLPAALSEFSGKEFRPGSGRDEDRFPPFCASEARARRARGESPADFVDKTRHCLSGYRDIIEEAGASPDEKKEADRFLECFFDRLALGFCLEWFRLAEEQAADLKGKEMQADRRRAREQLAGFASGVAHEVRNPLHALMSVTEALGQELQDKPEADTYLYHIRTQIDRLSQLMRDLLQVGKTVDPSKIRRESLREICLAAISTWRGSRSGEGLAVSFVCQPGDEEVAVLTDGVTLQQVLLSLLDNAGQHSPAGSEIEVAISVPRDEFAAVRVTDRGSGIPEEFRQRIFEPFFSTRRGGTGLGLTIIKDSLESQGGSVAIWNNDPPPGATAEITLPRAEGGPE